jgi:hypothetical protein
VIFSPKLQLAVFIVFALSGLLYGLRLPGLSWEVLKGGTNAIGGLIINDTLKGGEATDRRPREICGDAETHWKSTDSIGTRTAYEEHLRLFANCNFAGVARERLKTFTRNEPSSKCYANGNASDCNNLPSKIEQPIDDRYVLPAKVSTIAFAQCLSTHAIVDGRDYTIKEVSSVYRVLIPTLGGRPMSVGYDECRDRLTRR